MNLPPYFTGYKLAEDGTLYRPNQRGSYLQMLNET